MVQTFAACADDGAKASTAAATAAGPVISFIDDLIALVLSAAPERLIAAPNIP
jgi:hypothetical protein